MNKSHFLAACLLASISISAVAKLPALSEDAKAKADEAAAKTAWAGKQDIYQLCKVQDKVVAQYIKTARAAGKEAKSPAETPSCAEPGPFAYTPLEAKPLEASGAHSPAGTAVSPPSTIKPEAESAETPAKK